MPRNVEYLLEQALNDNNHINFILTYAIAIRIQVPEEILNLHGSGYGVDNEFSSMSTLLRMRGELSKIPKPKNNLIELSLTEVQLKIDKEYDRLENDYIRKKTYLNQKIHNFRWMFNKINEFAHTNKKQADIKTKVLKYLNREARKCSKDLQKLFLHPKLDINSYIKKHGLKKLHPSYELSASIKRLEKELIHDPAFCETIERDWLSKDKI